MNGRTYVPLRAVGEALALTLMWITKRKQLQ
nr:stalk domain-containing protein [Paenibacillus sp. 453mf]